MFSFDPLKACRDFLSLAQNHSKRWQKALQVERGQRIRLEETLEQLAKQHNHLERAFRGATVLPPSFSNPALGNKGIAGVSAVTVLRVDVFLVEGSPCNAGLILCSLQVLVQAKAMPATRTMTMSSLMQWKTLQSLLRFRPTPSITS